MYLSYDDYVLAGSIITKLNYPPDLKNIFIELNEHSNIFSWI